MSETNPDEAVDREIPNAFARWARKVFGAPRHTHDLITGIHHRDETIERLVTQLARREVREVRTGTNERRSTIARLNVNNVDPFAFTQEKLRVESQYIAQCEACAASGMVRCGTCHGSCTATCHNCGGSGKQRSEKTGRPINCKVCKKSGRTPCGACAATGRVACSVCFGSGHQLAWLTFEETDDWRVSLSPPESPVFLAHRELKKTQPLGRPELSAFFVVEEKQSHGPIDLCQLGEPYRQLPSEHGAMIDTRRERIKYQQYLRLAVVRRDVTYEMCGAAGTVVLSGTELEGSTTPDALHPIRRRLYLWSALVALVATASVLMNRSMFGSSSYFDTGKGLAWGASGFAIFSAIPAFGTALRSWRSGGRFRGPGHMVAGLSIAMLAGLGAIPLVAHLMRPTISEVDAYLSSGNLATARIAVDALNEGSASPEARDADDRVMLAEAQKSLGSDRLKLLDKVAARKGTSSSNAAALARGERLSQIRSRIGQKDAKGALAAIEEWFPTDKTDEVAEQRALSHELRVEACSDDPCRLGAGVDADAAHATTTRTERVASLRAAVWNELSVERVTEASALPRLEQLRQLSAYASSSLNANSSDAELRTRALSANVFVQAEREKIPILGSKVDVADALLGPRPVNEPAFSLGGTTVYLATDQIGGCTGIYAVGSSPANRALSSSTWSPQRILSQALGRAATVRPAAAGSSTSSWYDRGIPIAVRWSYGSIVELRIGDAIP